MFNIEEEKDKLTKSLSEQFSRNVITIEEYERLLDYINKIETTREIYVLEKIIQENDFANKNELAAIQHNTMMIPASKATHLSMFSWRTSDLQSVNGNGGSYTSFFGANRIMVDSLPPGRTVLHVNSIFGLTEIVVSKNIKITNRASPVFSGIFVSEEINREGGDLPELYITGKAVFGNITVQPLTAPEVRPAIK